MALMSCEHIPEKPFMVIGYKPTRIGASDCYIDYNVVDKSGCHYYFTEMVECGSPSKYMLGDTLSKIK